jgi:hypothetical protein
MHAYYVTLKWTRFPAVYYFTLKEEGANSYFANKTIEDALYGNIDANKFIVKQIVSSSETSAFVRLYIDYIDHSGVYSSGGVDTSIITNILPAIISLAMLGVALGMIRK